MRTIGKHWPRRVRGDYPAICSICGVPYPRSSLVKKADGLWYCPNDRDGRDAVTLSRLNAARRPRPLYGPMDAPVESVSPYSAAGVVPVELEFLIGDDGSQLMGEDGALLISEESAA